MCKHFFRYIQRMPCNKNNEIAFTYIHNKRYHNLHDFDESKLLHVLCLSRLKYKQFHLVTRSWVNSYYQQYMLCLWSSTNEGKSYYLYKSERCLLNWHFYFLNLYTCTFKTQFNEKKNPICNYIVIRFLDNKHKILSNKACFKRYFF